LFELLVGVVQRYEPQVAAVLREERSSAGMPAPLLARTLQAQGIWFQLLAIAEQNRDMRNRREVERERGYEQLRGTFAGVFASAAAAGISGAEIREALLGLRVRPVITAHPTEAKRVTVLERHRRIYLRLLDLESPRWTDRERQDLIRAMGDEIELLWLTGELKLAKPTVAQEVAWGLYFFNENLFDVVPQMFAKVESAFAKQFPDEPFEAPLFFQFGSWIGGDRDGNPYVTSEVTRRTLWETRLASLAPACWTWCATSASRITRSTCRIRSATRWPRRLQQHPAAKSSPRAIAAKSSANFSAACWRASTSRSAAQSARSPRPRAADTATPTA